VVRVATPLARSEWRWQTFTSGQDDPDFWLLRTPIKGQALIVVKRALNDADRLDFARLAQERACWPDQTPETPCHAGADRPGSRWRPRVVGRVRQRAHVGGQRRGTSVVACRHSPAWVRRPPAGDALTHPFDQALPGIRRTSVRGNDRRDDLSEVRCERDVFVDCAAAPRRSGR
jgi:hypothetical protein